MEKSTLILVIILISPHYLLGEQPRYLVYTNGGVFKFVLGWAIPLELPMSVIFAHNLQFQYPPIENATQLNELVQHGLARSRGFTKTEIYSHLEYLLKWQNGEFRNCILKIVCQVSETPLSHNGLFGEILQILFTPDLFKRDKYSEAWWYGQVGQDCEDIYKCPFEYSFLDNFSIVKSIHN